MSLSVMVAACYDFDSARKKALIKTELGQHRVFEQPQIHVEENPRALLIGLVWMVCLYCRAAILRLAAWNNADPADVIPDALAKGIGLYGFCQPAAGNGTIPLEKILPQPLSSSRTNLT